MKTPELPQAGSFRIIPYLVCRRDISLNCNSFYFHINHHKKRKQRKYRKCAFHFHPMINGAIRLVVWFLSLEICLENKRMLRFEYRRIAPSIVAPGPNSRSSYQPAALDPRWNHLRCARTIFHRSPACVRRVVKIGNGGAIVTSHSIPWTAVQVPVADFAIQEAIHYKRLHRVWFRSTDRVLLLSPFNKRVSPCHNFRQLLCCRGKSSVTQTRAGDLQTTRLGLAIRVFFSSVERPISICRPINIRNETTAGVP